MASSRRQITLRPLFLYSTLYLLSISGLQYENENEHVDVVHLYLQRKRKKPRNRSEITSARRRKIHRRWTYNKSQSSSSRGPFFWRATCHSRAVVAFPVSRTSEGGRLRTNWHDETWILPCRLTLVLRHVGRTTRNPVLSVKNTSEMQRRREMKWKGKIKNGW